MIPSQSNAAVRAFVMFDDHPDLLYTTPVTHGLPIEKLDGIEISILYARDFPKHFVSRVNRLKTCRITFDAAPTSIERVELPTVSWTGGAGTIKDYFKLNGHQFSVAEGHDHEVNYSILPVHPGLLKLGANTIELRSDTVHHGIEILSPGPALVVRFQNSPRQR